MEKWVAYFLQERNGMKHYPLIFPPHGCLVAGNGFVARVVIRGRCLLEETSDDFFSVLGVNPGAVAGDGANTGEAYHDFLEQVKINVFEIADEAADFAAFKTHVERFVNQTNRPNEALWNAAVALVRAGEVDLEGVRRERAESAPWVTVERVAVEKDADSEARAPESSLNETAAAHEDFTVAA